MKKLFCVLIAAGLIGSVANLNQFKTYKTINCAYADTAIEQDSDIVKNCDSAYLCEYNSHECIYKLNETKKMPIASVCKVMTLTLCFDAIKDGKLDYDTQITISDNASVMGGSQVFLQSGLKYPLSELIKSIIVSSANDSCVAVAESVCGSEQAFVALMNKKADELGCENTLFANCTGLPQEPQYSCAKDVSIMFSNLLNYEDYYKFSKIWLEDFKHPDDRTTTITNTNKLIKKYSFCDGGKTGFTNQAGFCLASTAIKDNMRLISVVLGAKTSNDRFESSINMFEYGFENYKNKIVLDSTINLSDKINVSGSTKKQISVHPARQSYVFARRDEEPKIQKTVTAYDIKAPVSKGELVGKIEVYKDGIICDTVDLLASEEAPKANYLDYLKKVAEDWKV